MTIDHNHKHQLMVESTFFFFLDSVVCGGSRSTSHRILPFKQAESNQELTMAFPSLHNCDFLLTQGNLACP